MRKRRSQRLEWSLPVVVYRPPNKGAQFFESTHTLVISAHGALLTLATDVVPKQRLVVQNVSSGEQQECYVVYLKKLTGPTEVAVEFVRPVPSFWHIAYPPAD